MPEADSNPIRVAEVMIAAAASRVRQYGPLVPLVVIGFIALALGLLVYLSDRDTAKSAFIPAIALLAKSDLFGALGGSLPSFIHPFAFSLFTAAALPQRSTPRYGACVAWFAVNAAFEIGQHPQINVRLAESLYAAFGNAPFSELIARYFLQGTFDAWDVAAALFGALAAASVLRVFHRG